MFYKKKGTPEENEIVICVVKKILPHSVFVDLEEYENLEGMIHISEIAPGRIRNIRDYVVEGKRIICKVLKIYPGKNQFDLSLRRVSLQAAKAKNEEYKLETKAEKILELVGNKLKKSLKEIYEEVGYRLIERYGSLHAAFQEILNKGENVLKELKVKKEIIGPLVEFIRERIKPPEVTKSVVIMMKCYEPNGIEVIKNALKAGEEFAKRKKYNIEISYLGAPRYKLVAKAKNYKEVEKVLEETKNTIIEFFQKNRGEISIEEK